ncbi:MAG: mechanosensitive ion channel family protein [Deltaproteobacteria bacterium]|nr:mechanosensitive ion channel family protein [Deltaproteobacteria bacterium]
MIQWFHLNPFAHGVLILLFGALIGYVLYLILIKITRGRTPVSLSPIRSPALQYIWLPLILTTIAIFADDAIERAGLNVYFWWDEFLAMLQSLPVIAWTWQLIAICRFYFFRLTDQHTEETNVVHSLALVSNLITLLFIVGGCYVILRIWSLDLSPLLTSAGLVTAVGAIAARDALSDFLGGITIFLDRPYHIGDFVVLTSGERGEVVNIGIRSTKIRTRDDVHISVPNSVMIGAKTMNETSLVPQYRVRCRVGVAYNSDLLEVENVLLDSLKDNPFVLHEPEPRVRYRDFGDWAVELEVLAWIKDPRDRGFARDLIIRGIHQAFRDEKIDIPCPQKEITIKKDE